MSAKVKICNAAAIIFSIFGEWTGLMSGSFSVLFTAAAFHFEGHERRMFVFLAFGALLVLVIRLAYKNYPKFKLACSKDIALCAPKDADVARYFRMRVSTGCVNGIDQCSGNLEKIERDGIVVYEGDATELPFAKPDKRTEISILMKPDIDYWLDILVVTTSRHSEIQLRIFMANAASGGTLPEIKDIVYIRTKPPSPANYNGIYAFEKIGDYILYVSVSGKGVPTAKAKLKFNWTGKADTSTIERIQ